MRREKPLTSSREPTSVCILYVVRGHGKHDTYPMNSFIHLSQPLSAGALQSGTYFFPHLLFPFDLGLWRTGFYQSSDHSPLLRACTKPFSCFIYVFTPFHHHLPILFPRGLVDNHSNVFHVYPFVCMCSSKIQRVILYAHILTSAKVLHYMCHAVLHLFTQHQLDPSDLLLTVT